MRRRERWLTREERVNMQVEIAAAGGAGAWIRAARPCAEDVRERHARINALAVKHGLAPPYPERPQAAPEDEA